MTSPACSEAALCLGADRVKMIERLAPPVFMPSWLSHALFVHIISGNDVYYVFQMIQDHRYIYIKVKVKIFTLY